MNDNRGGISPVPGEGEWEALVRLRRLPMMSHRP